MFTVKGYDFNDLLSNYDVSKNFMLYYNKHFINKDIGVIDIEDIGLHGRFLKDLRMGSWKKHKMRK